MFAFFGKSGKPVSDSGLVTFGKKDTASRTEKSADEKKRKDTKDAKTDKTTVSSIIKIQLSWGAVLYTSSASVKRIPPPPPKNPLLLNSLLATPYGLGILKAIGVREYPILESQQDTNTSCEDPSGYFTDISVYPCYYCPNPAHDDISKIKKRLREVEMARVDLKFGMASLPTRHLKQVCVLCVQ